MEMEISLNNPVAISELNFTQSLISDVIRRFID